MQKTIFFLLHPTALKQILMDITKSLHCSMMLYETNICAWLNYDVCCFVHTVCRFLAGARWERLGGYARMSSVVDD